MAEKIIYFTARFRENEYRQLIEKAEKAGVSRQVFLRRAVTGKEVNVAPTAEVPVLIMEVRRVGNILDQILKEAKGKGFRDTEEELRKALEENRSMEKMISGAYGSEWR